MADSAQNVTQTNAPLYATPHVVRLQLTDFRSYESLHLNCAPAPVALSGENGAGKTNILEAISLLGPGRGLRRAGFDKLARKNGTGGWAVAAYIDMPPNMLSHAQENDLTDGTIHIGVGMDANMDKRRLRINHAPAKGFNQLTQYVPQLWLTPPMDRLFVDNASQRRQFFDRFTQALIIDHRKNCNKYEKAMRERNRLLQENGVSQKTWLDGLETIMANTAIAIAEARLQALDALADSLTSESDKYAHMRVQNNDFPQAHIALEGEIEAALRDRPAIEVETDFKTRLATNRFEDAKIGRTLIGPHRSDFIVRHAEKDIFASDCSTGEQKALLVGLVLAQARILAQRTALAPLLLLDEIAAHLDRRRQQALFEAILALGSQAWMTGTEARIFAEFSSAMTHLQVINGRIIPLDVV
ncbi:MAG: DNA replication/repair protein RecF, partial [Alphaproteobacteria bacterium]|nr:DNA replication/repair protein RecF [Alphaproteobacteria bacterium]